MKIIKKIALVLGVGIAASAVLLPPIDAQALTCGEFKLDVTDDTVRAAINEAARQSGDFPIVERISRRKTFVLHQIDWLRSSGCQVSMIAGVTLHRRLRRDAHGHASISGILHADDNQVCVKDVHVNKVKVSHTTAVTEWLYKKAANRSVRDSFCVPREHLEDFISPTE